MDYRAEQENKMIKKSCLLGEVTTVNLTMLDGGVQYNVVPDKLKAVVITLIYFYFSSDFT